ncbi:aromatic acid/H+ symport family MFS transporter [Saccharopolyspora sp. TS4A08]|uniref:Aromatic acid/H+ symport family MFS transporter n=1 Tax=Saccharopolyspora ipomoeae TaxID=3042027 RepID=A0ABT6PQK3_9PSEU|nr:aromatic acid/H+ symport family MFS transporter [Saccharopolyspora sp. TS4A08]MDI2030280.1 aromatic acid/H+ symport family MFS transporter [Saccharopolyspora sp. TS4A08]
MSETDSTTRRRQRTVSWVVALSTIVLIFDGYDLVVYGTVLPTLLKDPSQLGAITPGQAGTLGSYALIGVLVGALAAGTFGDLIGRRRIMLINLAWFSIGMGATALTQSVTAFGIGRFFTGIGVGALVATVGPLVAEFADPGRRNRLNAIVYSGVPAGGVLAALLALVLDDLVGWRGLFWIGALPLVLVLPLAAVKLPESPKWLASRGEVERATELAERTGIELRAEPVRASGTARAGFPALASKELAWPTALLGLMSFAGLLLTYGLNTWLPQIMANNGFGKSDSLAFLLVLNVGAIVGGVLASLWADRVGAKRVVATTFVLAAATLVLLPLKLPLLVLLSAVAVAGTGTIGTQVLIYGLVSNYYPTRARAAGVAWCAGFGRIGGIVGPVVGGVLVGAGLGGTTAFYLFAGIAASAALVTLLVPRSHEEAADETPTAVPTAGSTHAV